MNLYVMHHGEVASLDKNIWYDIDKEIVYKDSEGFKSILNRIYKLLDEIKEKYNEKNILLITHGDVCKAIYMYFNRNNKFEISEIEQKNCEIVHYKY